MSTTFHCPFCGAPINGAAPGATFACPYCRAKVMAPYDGGAGAGGGHRGWDGGASSAREAGPFSTGLGQLAVTIDPQFGFVAVGVHAPHGQPPCLRAWDIKNRRALWDVLQGQPWLERQDEGTLAIRGRNVYIANKRQLLCLDLANGNKKWNAALSDTAMSGGPGKTGEDGLAIGDPFPPGQRGAILVPTIDHNLFAFDRDTGQPLWQRSFGDKEIEVEAVAALGACVIRYGAPYIKIEIVNPAYPQPIASMGHDHWSTDLGHGKVWGRTIVTVVDDMGPEGDDDGLLCFDAVTGQRHFFDPASDLDEDVTPCIMGQRVFAATSNGEALYVGLYGRAMPPPVPNHAIAALCPAGPTLVVLLKKSHGTPVRRVVGLDPNTLQFRFDAGEAGSEPDGDWDRQYATDGYSFVYVATPEDDMERCELRSIDTSTGRQLWSRPVGAWRGHRFVSGQLIVWSDEKIEALAPQNGQPLGSLGSG